MSAACPPECRPSLWLVQDPSSCLGQACIADIAHLVRQAGNDSDVRSLSPSPTLQMSAYASACAWTELLPWVHEAPGYWEWRQAPQFGTSCPAMGVPLWYSIDVPPGLGPESWEVGQFVGGLPLPPQPVCTSMWRLPMSGPGCDLTPCLPGQLFPRRQPIGASSSLQGRRDLRLDPTGWSPRGGLHPHGLSWGSQGDPRPSHDQHPERRKRRRRLRPRAAHSGGGAGRQHEDRNNAKSLLITVPVPWACFDPPPEWLRQWRRNAAKLDLRLTLRPTEPGHGGGEFASVLSIHGERRDPRARCHARELLWDVLAEAECMDLPVPELDEVDVDGNPENEDTDDSDMIVETTSHGVVVRRDARRGHKVVLAPTSAVRLHPLIALTTVVVPPRLSHTA